MELPGSGARREQSQKPHFANPPLALTTHVWNCSALTALDERDGLRHSYIPPPPATMSPPSSPHLHPECVLQLDGEPRHRQLVQQLGSKLGDISKEKSLLQEDPTTATTTTTTITTI